MSLRNNKAVRLNRFMMYGTIFLGILVIGCAFAFLYMVYNKPDDPQAGQGGDAADSLLFLVSDSTLVMDSALVIENDSVPADVDTLQ